MDELLVVLDNDVEGQDPLVVHRALLREVAALDGPIRPVLAVSPASVGAVADDDLACLLVRERSLSTNTAAAGGNASLMTIA